jgi:hypothetical protein
MTDEEIERVLNYCDAVQEANGFFVGWWMPPHNPIDFSAPHPYPNAKVMTFGRIRSWTPDGFELGPLPEPQPITGSSWLHLWAAADKLIIAALGDEAAQHLDEIDEWWVNGFIDHGTTLELCASRRTGHFHSRR